ILTYTNTTKRLSSGQSFCITTAIFLRAIYWQRNFNRESDIVGDHFFIFIGRHTKFFLKVLSKIFGFIEAHQKGHLANIHLTFSKKLCGSFESYKADKLRRRFVCEGEDLLIKINPAHRHLPA